MKQNIKNEIKKLIKSLKLKCTVDEFKDKVNWGYISENQKLSEDFIKEFKDKVDWDDISIHQNLSEDFIKEFKDKVSWYYISMYQKLSKDLIREFKDEVNWSWISKYQKLSEDFIRDFKNRVNWYRISKYQKLSENFIREFKDKVNWDWISEYQKLSEYFIREFKNKININVQMKNHHREYDPIKEAKDYAKKHNLKTYTKYLYAYRNHDRNGSGMYNKTISYEKGIYHQDWRCDLNPDNRNSFGLGIFPKGNTKVRIKLTDFGCEVKDSSDGKARVWGFEIV